MASTLSLMVLRNHILHFSKYYVMTSSGQIQIIVINTLKMLKGNDFAHSNPIKFKIPFPILRNTSKYTAQQNVKCPKIDKFRHHRSLAQIQEFNQFEKLTPQEHEFDEEQAKELKQNFNSLLKENSELMNILNEKEMRMFEVHQKYEQIQQKYTRLLEVSNERSQQQIDMLMSRNDSNVSRSKIKNEIISEKASQLKAKLEKLDLSMIQRKQAKQSLFFEEVHII